MKILCGIDFSEQSARALRLASDLARRFGDELALVHAEEPFPLFATGAAPVAADLLSNARAQEHERLVQWAAGPLDAGIAVEHRVISGFADETLVAVAHDIGARVIVVGSHGRRGVRRWILGSVAERVLRTADRPVVVVRGAGDRLSAWADGSRALRVIAGVDVTAATDPAVEWLRSARRTAPCDLTFVHIVWPNPYRPRTDAQKLVETALERRLGTFPGQGTLELRVLPEAGSIAASLAKAAADGDFDLVVIGRHPHDPLDRALGGATGEALIRSLEIPVAIIPPRPEQPFIHRRPLPVIRTVLCATDLSAIGNASVAQAYDLVTDGGVVVICYVYEPHGDPQGLLPEARQRIEASLRALVPSSAESRNIETETCLIGNCRPAEGILRTASRLGVDLICMGSHGSVAEEVVANAARPVFVVRQPADMRQ